MNKLLRFLVRYSWRSTIQWFRPPVTVTDPDQVASELRKVRHWREECEMARMYGRKPPKLK